MKLLEDGIFTRGKHEGKSLEDMALDDPRYLIFLVEESETDEETKEAIEEYMEIHPEVQSMADAIRWEEQDRNDPYGWKGLL